jgi:glycine hydroxymethyltransferase
MHVIAAKAIAFKEALEPCFKDYAKQIKKNAQVMAEVLTKRGLRVVSGRTESHVLLIDLRSKNTTGKAIEKALEVAHITVNKNAIPNDPEKFTITSGIRIGTPAITTRGFKEAEASLLANLLADVTDSPDNIEILSKVRQAVVALCQHFPVYDSA